MDAFARFLTDNAVIIAALAAVAYSILTYMLWSDARTFRTSANVSVYPAPFDPSARYAAVVAVNYGPAVARDFDLRFHLVDEGGADIGGARHHREPVLGPGRPRRFLPRVADNKLQTLQELADMGARVELEWEWRDQSSLLGDLRRRLPQGSLGQTLFGDGSAVRGRRHKESATFSLTELRDGLYGGGAVADRDALDALPDLHKAVAELMTEVRGIHQIMAEPGLQRAREAGRAQLAIPAATPAKPRRGAARAPAGGPAARQKPDGKAGQ